MCRALNPWQPLVCRLTYNDESPQVTWLFLKARAESMRDRYPRFLEPVIAHRVIVKQHPLFARAKLVRNRMKGRIQRVEIAIQLIDRKIAGKHATTDTEDLDGFEYKRADTIGAPMPVKGTEAGNFGHDIRDGS